MDCTNSCLILSRKMRYIAAYMLAVMGGNENPRAEDLVNILSSVGIEAEPDRLEIVINKLRGKNLDEVMEKGRELLATTVSTTPVTQNGTLSDMTQHNGGCCMKIQSSMPMVQAKYPD